MKRVLLFTFFIIIPFISNGQSDFVKREDGAELFYSTYDENGDLIYTFCQKIVSSIGDFKNGEIVFKYNYFDSKDEPMFKGKSVVITALSKDGVTSASIDDFKMAFNIESIMIKGDVSSIPSSLSIGGSIGNSELKLHIKNFTANIYMYDRKVVAIEELNTLCGTINCYKLTEWQRQRRIGRTMVNKIITWYSLGIGVVKQEVYDSDGKLLTVTNLSKIV